MVLDGDLYDSTTASVMEEEKGNDETAADAVAGHYSRPIKPPRVTVDPNGLESIVAIQIGGNGIM